MFIKIPFESDIPFKTNIYEITKMSLEHDFNVNEDVVLGNFYVSGEYRSYEVSVNTEPFTFTLPFSVDIREDIKKDSLEFNIEDFAYEIISDNTLKVKIEYSLKGELEELFNKVDERELESELEYIDNFLTNDETFEEKEEVCEDALEERVSVKEELQDERITLKEEKTIMETIKNSDDTFVTYHIHIVKENESIENVCAAYHTTTSQLSEYNDLTNITTGDKILIPELDA